MKRPACLVFCVREKVEGEAKWRILAQTEERTYMSDKRHMLEVDAVVAFRGGAGKVWESGERITGGGE